MPATVSSSASPFVLAGEGAAAHEWAAIEASIRGEMLPLLRATGVQPTDPID